MPPNQEGWDDGWHQISDVIDLYPTVQYRYLMAPSFDVMKKVGLFETDHDKSKMILKQGLLDAKDVLSKPAGHNFRRLKKSLVRYPKTRENSAKFATDEKKFADMTNLFHFNYF